MQYTNNLKVVRVTNSGLLNASADGTGTLIKNTDDYLNNYAAGQGAVGTFALELVAWGNNLQVSTCPSATAFEQNGATTINDSDISVGDTTITVTDGGTLNVGDILAFQQQLQLTTMMTEKQYRITGISTHDITIVQHQRGSGG